MGTHKEEDKGKGREIRRRWKGKGGVRRRVGQMRKGKGWRVERNFLMGPFIFSLPFLKNDSANSNLGSGNNNNF